MNNATNTTWLLLDGVAVVEATAKKRSSWDSWNGKREFYTEYTEVETGETHVSYDPDFEILETFGLPVVAA